MYATNVLCILGQLDFNLLRASKAKITLAHWTSGGPMFFSHPGEWCVSIVVITVVHSKSYCWFSVLLWSVLLEFVVESFVRCR